jgi:energy-coupling factor transport system permease protein
MSRRQSLALQTWVIWGAAASVPFLLGRNPFPMAIALAAAIAVNRACRPAHSHAVGWGVVIRTSLIFSVIAVLFNVLTVRTGDLVLVTIPEGWPLFDGPITWNAIIYGLLAAAGVLGLVTVWATVGSMIQWSALARLLPDPFVGFAVAGSAAINLVPQTAAALTDIREAAAARGYRPAGARGVATVLTPMINVGLDRSMRLAEVLEARGFGGRRAQAGRLPVVREAAWTALLGGIFIAGYGLIAAIDWALLGGMVAASVGAAAFFFVRSPDPIRRTKYRQDSLTRTDWMVMATSTIVAIACVVARNIDAKTFVYEPYPGLDIPSAELWPLLILLGLFAPALIAPSTGPSDD